jgi:hypothetical protein
MPVMDIVRDAIAVVEVALFAGLSREVLRLRARGHRTSRDVAELSRTVGTVQGWAAQELQALRSELAARVPEDDAEEQRDTVAMPAPTTPTAPLGDDDDATSVFDREPPLYALRFPTMRSPALREPLAHPDLIGCEDIADEADPTHLGPDERTPPRRGRSAVLVPAFRGPEQGGA